MLRSDVLRQLRAANPPLAKLRLAAEMRVGEPSGIGDLPAHIVAAELPERCHLRAQTGKVMATTILEAAEKGRSAWKFSGYSTAYGVVFWGRWGYQQVVEPGALDRSMAAESTDVVLVGIGHDGLPHARTVGVKSEMRKLHLSSDSYGQLVEAQIPVGDPSGDMIRARIDDGMLTEMSLVATIVDYEWGGGDYSVQRITELDQDRGDVSIVIYGMNPAATILPAAGVSASAPAATESPPPSTPPGGDGGEPSTEVASGDTADTVSLRAEMEALERL